MRYFFPFFLIISFNVSAQVYVGPMQYDPARSAPDNQNFRLAAAADSLPFFEDFSTYKGNPDPSLWEQNGGAFINDSYGYLPPTLGVATFDGMDANGMPYGGTELLTKGAADTLTSLSIDLSSYTPSDSVILSFFWQGAGIGDIPDSTQGDTLTLAFRDTAGTWVPVWKEYGDSTEFRQELIALKDLRFFHEDFAFRFISYGQTSGSYDVWNLDYILLDKNRTISDIYYEDQGHVHYPATLLKNYQAMPWKQFFADPANSLKDSLVIPFRNLNNKGQLANSEDTSYVQDLITGDTLFHFTPSGTVMDPDTLYYFYWDVQKANFSALNRPLQLGVNLLYDTGNKPPFHTNESATGTTVITDYFAHDDGSAEAIFGNNDNKGANAVRFTLNQPDSLIAVDIAFIRQGSDQTGERIQIVAWSSITPWGTGETDVAVSEQEVEYKNGGFKRYFFDQPVLVSGPVYVGFRQFTNDYIYVGFDLNTQTPDSIYYWLDGVWNEYLFYPGSLMIRPVFGTSDDIATSVPGRRQELDCSVFPNPTSGLLRIEGKVSEVQVFDLTGRLLLSETLAPGKDQVDLSLFPEGVYMIHLLSGELAAVKRVFKGK